ncbi:MAG TPA: hypothetical protein DDZ81_07940 [Acetobacteraceae bacterium]|jgi:hypothetical protein|nr:hypothetical protein [Acetobacteraceae bacterium]
MPTISQLPSAASVIATDEVPISQGGIARSASIGEILASTQPVISIGSPSLLGRTSLGAGSPEEVNIGPGLQLGSGTLAANGLDHASFPLLTQVSPQADLVVSSQGSPMLMQAALLRGLFSAGANVDIDPNGVISSSGAIGAGSSIDALQVITGLSSQDLVAVSQSGVDRAISYSNFLDGITIDQAQAAAPATDADWLWVAQGTNVMTRQTFGAIWSWLTTRVPNYKPPVVEIATNTNLDTTVHNGRILICSQPVTLTPLTANMGNGFQCEVINASSGSLTLGTGFVTSNGSLALTPWQSATLSCVTYSGGTVAFASMPTAGAANALPGQVVSVSNSLSTSSTITVAWQAPSSGGAVSSYTVQYRPTGTSAWSASPLVVNATSYLIAGLQPSSSYDIFVQAQNATGVGLPSGTLTAVTTAASTGLPAQVTGLVANPTTSSSVQLTWSGQTGSTAATSFTVLYRVTGTASWTSWTSGVAVTTSTISGLLAATSYDFEVEGANASGSGPASPIVTASTPVAAQSVTSIVWNVTPIGPYTLGSGAIGINAHVSPATSPIQFGFSSSPSTPASSWTAAILVNTDLWGAYVPLPLTSGTYYAWAEGLDGSAATASATAFVVQ